MIDINREIEAIIFMSDKAIPIEELAIFFNKSLDEMRDILKKIKEDYEDRGINILISQAMLKLITNPL